MPQAAKEKTISSLKSLPHWFRQDLPDMEKIRKMKTLISDFSLHSVCESAHCPNQGTCWGQGVATFMILGDICTRKCQFCAVDSGTPLGIDQQEPGKVAEVVKALDLSYVVITSVTRDDLEDQGAEHFAETVDAIKKEMPNTKVEVLIPDLSGEEDLLKVIINASPDVIGHNMETVRRLFPQVRPRTNYFRSLEVLKTIKEVSPGMVVKSGFMVGLGEDHEEVYALLDDLISVRCDIVTIGQYLSPGIEGRNADVKRFISPEEFKVFKHYGEKQGLKYVLSEPLARSSFLAEEGYSQCIH